MLQGTRGCFHTRRGFATTPGGASKHPWGCSVPRGRPKPPPGGVEKRPGGRSCEARATVYISTVAFRVSGGPFEFAARG
nr:MAG TPA: hypothetical protein [Caudoviricetes sp.]